ncbi:MAG TPA: ABC-F family ATP-binding cassette domain-containing protein [Chloroflexota bacterium]
MSILSIGQIGVSFGANDILRGISAEVNASDRIGLVGANGAGKTTLLRVLAGALPPTAGRRNVARSIRTALVEQVASVADPTNTVMQEARSAIADVLDLEAQLQEASERLGGDHPERDERYSTLLNLFEARGGFTYPSRIEQILIGLGFREPDWDKPVEVLSGGQRGRLALAKGLLAQPDLLLMDEPTNHLDLAGLRWLEGFVSQWKGSLIVTSHDRYFLDAVATRIWLLEDGRMTSYPGNYSRFEQLRAAELDDLEKRYEAQQAVIAKEEAFIRRYGAGQRAREAAGRAKKLTHLERLSAPADQKTVSLKLTAARSGDIALRAGGLAVGYANRTIINAGDLEVMRGARIAVIGPNGSGKSTLLKSLAGELPPSTGNVTLGSRVEMGFYHQEAENLDSEATVLDEVLGSAQIDGQQARDFLGRFLFSGDDVAKRISQLSGGERGRLAIAKLVLSKANFLLLDEPTNHLDIASRTALEEALDAYPGTLIFASHDRRLINRLANRLWVLGDGKLIQVDGGLAEYEQLLRPQVSHGASPTPKQTKAPLRERPLSRSKTEQRLEHVEEQIASLESALTVLGGEIEEAGKRADLKKITELGTRFAQSQAELDDLFAEWAQLSEAI